ncbi:protein kinase [Cystobacter fuscus]|uniref:serine/threonine-protein kinase n=1 Tax=Cystobacter fuscus TaxID=43 RepID=UPI002B289908|nr:protein kinase [Cystobacter fuscus]
MDNDETAPSAPGLDLERLSRGTIIAERFAIEHLAGRGGMGVVYRARDGVTGRPVALKLLQALGSPESAFRFNREALLMAGLHHPGLVAHVAHGATERGQPFLAMEWLEGEELARRLTREPLSLPETLALLRRAAEALAHAHQQGIVHRDIKPSNLFLRAGRPEDVVVLDFGLARYAVPTIMGVTGSSTVVGTPGYMAPEQASSQPEIPPAADVFSLGCVLYECLTGQPPFAAPHFAAALAKILFAEPAPLHALRPGLPMGLQVLVDRMLAKDSKRRLPDASALLDALTTLESVPSLSRPQAEEGPERASLTHATQEVVSVLLVSFPRPAHGVEFTHDVVARDSLRAMLVPHGAQVELLADGSLVVSLALERGTATDQAALAARCALRFKERWPEAVVVLVTGLGVLQERLPVGAAMERAGQLLRRMSRVDSSQVAMDEVTAGLLGAGFQLERMDSGTFVLRGEQSGADASRPLLGRPTPCVGRERELALLELTFNECVEEPTARAVLVTAPAGVGKSRLRHEFLRRLEQRESPPLVLVGRGDPMSRGTSYGLLGMALRGLCGIVDAQPQEEQRARLSERIARHLPRARELGTVEFLGELCAIPFDEAAHPHLRPARSDPRLMSTQMGRALQAFLEAECAHQPVVLVLEDLHWSDALTVRYVDEALRELAERPFLVLALARPEVRELFPQLWARRLQEVPLHGLSRKAGTRLVREVLGAGVPEALVRRLVDLSDGNALFLEELIRMADEGRGTEAPETVLAVLQSRLTRMAPGARQVLMAGSIFGRSFWSGGVAALLGPTVERETLALHLRELVAQELIEPRSDSHLPSEDEYRFRHALVRDAAHGLVPEGYLPEGHRLAGTWLEQMGEGDALVLATHHHLGQQPERALFFYTQAAERLFDLYDLPGTMRCVEAALACGAEGGEFVQLRALQSMVAFWSDDLSRSLALGAEGVDALEAGGRLWCWLVGGQIFGATYLGLNPVRAARLNEQLWRTRPDPKAGGAYTWAIACRGLSLVFSGVRGELEDWLGRMRREAGDGIARGWTHYMDGFFHHLFEAAPWRALLLAEQGTREFRELGLERDALIQQTLSGLTLGALGDVSGAVARMREVLGAGRALEAHLAVGGAQQYMTLVLVRSPDPEHLREAEALARGWVDIEDAYAFRRGMAHAVLAQVRAREGQLSEAEVHAREACALLTTYRADVIYARGILSAILLARGNALEAREVAALGVHELEESRGQGVYAVSIRLALAEACFGLGEGARAEAALRAALRCVWARARDIPDTDLRERFLRQISENARALALARERWGGDGLRAERAAWEDDTAGAGRT